MGNIKIQPVFVKAETNSIQKKIQSDILEKNRKTITKLKQYMHESKGENVKALKKQLDKEEQLVNGLGDILSDMMDYISMACNDFEQLDRGYASGKVQR